MIKVIDVCKRVEGNGNVKILLQNDSVNSIEFEIEAFRGFENLLIGKRLLEIPRIVSRICGLCHASQSIVSCKAIESMYNIEPSKQMINIRRLLMTGEMIKSHIMHFFFQSLPDLLRIFEIKNRFISPYELINFDPQLTTNIYELIKFGNEIDKLFGGRSVHLITTIPGGVIYNPSQKITTIAKRYFQKAFINIEYVIDYFINLFSDFEPPNEYILDNPTFFGMHYNGNYDRYNGNLRLLNTNRKPIDFEKEHYKQYLDRDPELRGVEFHLGKEKNVIVGPMARSSIIEGYNAPETTRFLDIFSKKWKKTILYSNFIRLIEMYVETNQALIILDKPILNTKQKLISLKTIKNQDGIGVIEAPRGTLMHHYYVDENKIVKEIKLFIATEINMPLINTMITDYGYKLYEKTGDINIVKERVQMIIRAFDPCISCASH